MLLRTDGKGVGGLLLTFRSPLPQLLLAQIGPLKKAGGWGGVSELLHPPP